MNNNRLEEKRNGGKKKELLYYIKNQAIRDPHLYSYQYFMSKYYINLYNLPF